MASRTAKSWAALEEASATNLNKPAGGWIGYASNSSDQTGISTTTDVTNVAETVTVNSSRLIGVFVCGKVTIQTAAADYVGRIQRGGASIGTWAERVGGSAGGALLHTGFAWDAPASGSTTYSVTLGRSAGTGTLDVSGTSPSNAKILIVDLGSSS